MNPAIQSVETNETSYTTTYHSPLALESRLSERLTRLREFICVFSQAFRWKMTLLEDAVRMQQAVLERRQEVGAGGRHRRRQGAVRKRRKRDATPRSFSSPFRRDTLSSSLECNASASHPTLACQKYANGRACASSRDHLCHRFASC